MNIRIPFVREPRGPQVLDTAELSDAARSVWAKSDFEPGVGLIGWLPLHRHLDDAAAVAGRLWDDWLPAAVKQVISDCLPGGEADGRILLCWLAGIHDIAKATPAFAVQVPKLADQMRSAGLAMPIELRDRSVAPHAMAGQLILTRWLESRYGWSRAEAAPFAVVVGGHHGVPPEGSQLTRARKHPELLGTGLWESVQDEFLDRAARRFGLGERLPTWQSCQLPQTAQVLLTAAVIVADWMASNTELFPYDSADHQAKRVELAWQALSLPPPWRPSTNDPLPNFAGRFGLPEQALPRPLQVAATRLASELANPGLMIIEAPMGEGKTEAALLVAEAFAAKRGSGGCFIALPTQATSNAMFSRVLDWLRRLPDDIGSPAARSVMLAHGKAHLNDDFRGLMHGRLRDIGRDESPTDRRASRELVAPAWLAGRKKAGLASFVIGTIDQLLFAGLMSRHLVLRHLSIAGKVVIIDEAHAYDVYMSTYLDRVLEWLGAYQVPTVVLSATLPAARRAELVSAYQKGRAALQITPERPTHSETGYPELACDLGYPVLIATSSSDSAVVQVVDAAARRTEVDIVAIDDELATLTQLLREALSDGGCAAVVRNTVKRVQETARRLADSLPDTTIVVAHSRFLGIDRTRLERQLLDLFGPAGSAQRRTQRFVVVASQVIEQSLDLDFDLLVTDLAPFDLMLQRMGRLHRHQRGVGQADRAPALRQARCVTTGVDWATTPATPVRGSQAVYQLYPLYRALAVLDAVRCSGSKLTLPDDIAPLVQRAYRDGDDGPASWQAALRESEAKFASMAEHRRASARTFRLGSVGPRGSSLVGWIAGGVGDASDDGPQGTAQVRDGRPGLEVLVIQQDEDGGYLTPSWLPRHGGRPIPTDEPVPYQLARIVAACSLQLPPVMCLPGIVDAVIADLERNCFPGWQQTYLLAGQLVLVLDPDGRARVADFELSYDPVYGLEYGRD